MTQAGINLGSKLSLHLPLSNDLVWFIELCWFIVISLVQNLTPTWKYFGFNASVTLRTLTLESDLFILLPYKVRRDLPSLCALCNKDTSGGMLVALLVASVLQTLIDALPACWSNTCCCAYYG